MFLNTAELLHFVHFNWIQTTLYKDFNILCAPNSPGMMMNT